MTSAKHTPTPWSTGVYGRITGDHQHLGMHGAVCTFVATCKDPDIGQDRQNWENRETWAPKAEANAAHIVHCVNSHAALVAALEKAERDIGAMVASAEIKPVYRNELLRIATALAAAKVTK